MTSEADRDRHVARETVRPRSECPSCRPGEQGPTQAATARVLLEWAEAGRERIAAYERAIAAERALVDGWERQAATLTAAAPVGE